MPLCDKKNFMTGKLQRAEKNVSDFQFEVNRIKIQFS